jgi:hypothetical protein
MAFSITSEQKLSTYQDMEDLFEAAQSDFRGKTISAEYLLVSGEFNETFYVDSLGEFWRDSSKSKAYEMDLFLFNGLVLEEQ